LLRGAAIPKNSYSKPYIQDEPNPVDYELTGSHIDFCPVCRQETDRLIECGPPRFLAD
jgi:hypothetical protein